MRAIRGFTFVLACACGAQQARVGPGGVITGALRGDDGTPIVGANVTLYLLEPFPPGHVRATQWVLASGAGGSFRFDVPYYAQYRLCAQAPNTAWLNPCEWGLQPPATLLSAAVRSQTVTVVMRKGAAVPIRVDDAGRLLAHNEGKTPGAHLLLGVSSEAHVFHQARVVSEDATGRNYQITVPFDVSVNLIINSAFFKLSDAAGQPLARTGSAMVPVTVRSGQQPAVVRLTVAGSAI